MYYCNICSQYHADETVSPIGEPGVFVCMDCARKPSPLLSSIMLAHEIYDKTQLGFRYAAPLDDNKKRWVLMIHDRDREYSVFDDEETALQAWKNTMERGFDCHLMVSVELK